MTPRKIFPVLAACVLFGWAVWWTATPLSRWSGGTTSIRPGVTHRTIFDRRGPWSIHVVEIDLRRPELRVESAVALDTYRGREALSSLSLRKSDASRSVVAALNGDYFNPSTGEVQNNQISAGTFVKAFTSPGPRPEYVDIPNSQFAVTEDRRPAIEQFMFSGTVLWHGHSRYPLAGVNTIPRRGGLTIFNGYRGERTPVVESDMESAELPLREVRRHSDTSFCVPLTLSPGHRGTPIPAGGMVLAAYGTARPILAGPFSPGDTIRIVLSMIPYPGHIRDLVGGWPRLVRDGKSIFRLPDFPENPGAPVFSRRHPRSGIGFSRDRATLYFITVDGRQTRSAGMSLPEFADLMITLGIDQGLNLDGGGSTTLVIDGEVVNSPSDPTGERSIGNALLLFAYP